VLALYFGVSCQRSKKFAAYWRFECRHNDWSWDMELASCIMNYIEKLGYYCFKLHSNWLVHCDCNSATSCCVVGLVSRDPFMQENTNLRLHLSCICIGNSTVYLGVIFQNSPKYHEPPRRVMFGEFWNITSRFLSQIPRRNLAIFCLYYKAEKCRSLCNTYFYLVTRNWLGLQ